MAKENGHADPARQEFVRQVQQHIPSLKAFGISLSGSVDRADDLVQETLYRAIKYSHLFRPGTNLNAWLFTILRNFFRSEYRKRRREATWDPEYENTIDFSSSFEGQDTSAELAQTLRYIACLSSSHRDALIAVGYLGMPYEEAANRLGCALGTVKSRVNRARELLFQWQQETRVDQVDLYALKHATRGVPTSDPYYPIARAYEELFSDIEGIGEQLPIQEDSALQKQWIELVASGALDNEDEFNTQQHQFE